MRRLCSFPKSGLRCPPWLPTQGGHTFGAPCDVGFDAAGIDPEMHHIVVNSWEGGVDTEQNVVLISIASVADPTMAPEGKHVLYAYTPATEPFSIWEGLDWKSEEYARLKEERSQVCTQLLPFRKDITFSLEFTWEGAQPASVLSSGAR